MGIVAAPKKVRNNRVLVINGNLSRKKLIEDILSLNGFDTRSAPHGEGALEHFTDWNPALVLLGKEGPGDGIEILRNIRSAECPGRPSVIMLSEEGDKDTAVKALSEGADDFIVMPFNEAEFLARVGAQMRISDFYTEVEEDKKSLETIAEITNTISATLDTSEVLNIIVSKVAEVTDAIRCSIVLIVKDDEGYVLASNDDPTIKELRIDLAKYPEIKKVVDTKSPLALDDMINHPLMSNVKSMIADLKGMSVLIVPIVFNDEVLGTLFLRTNRRDQGFSDKEIDFCKIVASASFHAIKNANLFEKITKEKEYLKEVAIRDQLTTLYNHNFFYTRLDEEFERAVRYETPLALIMIDVDNFKSINDTHGHRTGDAVLKEIGTLIKKGVRKSDIVARYGGEEFSVILPHTMLKGAVEEAERLREMVGSHRFHDVDEQISVSVGVAAYPQKGAMNSGDLVNYADDALYRAKWAGKNCVKVSEV